MEDMYNMRNSMQMPYYYPVTSCPLMLMQPVNINPMMIPMHNCLNCNMHNNFYRTASTSYDQRYGAVTRSSTFNPYLFQVEMRPVSIKEIED